MYVDTIASATSIPFNLKSFTVKCKIKKTIPAIIGPNPPKASPL